MTEFCSKITQRPVLYAYSEEIASAKPTCEIAFSTNDRRYFDRVEEVCRACIDKTATSELPKDINSNDDKTFGIVDAFMHLIYFVSDWDWYEGESMIQILYIKRLDDVFNDEYTAVSTKITNGLAFPSYTCMSCFGEWVGVRYDYCPWCSRRIKD